MISNVTAELKDFDADITSEDESFKNTDIRFVAKAESIHSRNEQRDNHLRSEDFLHAEEHPEIIFEARNVDATKGSITGDLTIRGITKKVTVDVEFNGVVKGLDGNKVAGFTLDGKINRKEWGLNWNTALEAGGVLVGEEVRLQASVELHSEM